VGLPQPHHGELAADGLATPWSAKQKAKQRAAHCECLAAWQHVADLLQAREQHCYVRFSAGLQPVMA
jgi:hypothetical protein